KLCIGWNLLTTAWGSLHRYDESLRCALKAQSLRPSDAKCVSDVAFAYANSGQWSLADKFSKQAIRMAQAALEANPGSARDVEAMRDAMIHQCYAQLAQKQWR